MRVVKRVAQSMSLDFYDGTGGLMTQSDHNKMLLHTCFLKDTVKWALVNHGSCFLTV
jgi:hypothetical protein